MQHFKIELDGNHFVESYIVYVIEVTNDQHGRYFYVGQTGDRNHFIARPAFRRLGAHLSDQGWSRENQLYRHIAKKILKHELEKNKSFESTVKIEVGEFLKKSRICMHVFPIRPFEFDKGSEHKKNREYVESIEKEVIVQLLHRYGADAVLNSMLPKSNQTFSQDVVDYAIRIIAIACLHESEK
jgi:hypothetical protein